MILSYILALIKHQLQRIRVWLTLDYFSEICLGCRLTASGVEGLQRWFCMELTYVWESHPPGNSPAQMPQQRRLFHVDWRVSRQLCAEAIKPSTQHSWIPVAWRTRCFLRFWTYSACDHVHLTHHWPCWIKDNSWKIHADSDISKHFISWMGFSKS